MNNTKEVGDEEVCCPSNSIRMNGSVQPEPTIGATNSDFGKSTPLDAGDTCGAVGKPTIGGDYVATPQKNASVTGPTGVAETTYDHANLSAKYKYPNVSQDIPDKGRNQYNDHS